MKLDHKDFELAWALQPKRSGMTRGGLLRQKRKCYDVLVLGKSQKTCCDNSKRNGQMSWGEGYLGKDKLKVLVESVWGQLNGGVG